MFVVVLSRREVVASAPVLLAVAECDGVRVLGDGNVHPAVMNGLRIREFDPRDAVIVERFGGPLAQAEFKRFRNGLFELVVFVPNGIPPFGDERLAVGRKP